MSIPNAYDLLGPIRIIVGKGLWIFSLGQRFRRRRGGRLGVGLGLVFLIRVGMSLLLGRLGRGLIMFGAGLGRLLNDFVYGLMFLIRLLILY